MSIRHSRWPAGVPCWADLTVPDVDAAKAFYTSVLGWTFGESDPEFGGYAIAETRGAAAAGVGPQQQAGMPAAWTLYLASDDADATAALVTENGGSVLFGPGDVGPLGRMFVAADPTGAAFGVWQAGSHIGAGITNEPGGLTWEDLRSPDPDAARDFYRAVFGYRTEALAAAGEGYHTFSLADGAQLGGMGGMMGAEGAPAHWVVYFGVSDAAAAVAACEQGGGSVLMRDFDTPYGRMAGLADPDGAVFWVAQTDPARAPDRSG